ncbi:MAG: 5-(carboxyamino)imidazole ribonucleotide synthase [Pseudohongiellaceae bacterium]|jgi:5-(carboxyamino)imidazole ribonucleotide synthase
MLALAGIPLGIKFSFIHDDATQDTRCVDGLGAVISISLYDDVSQLFKALGEPDCITIEKEQVDSELLAAFQKHCHIYPNIEAVKACQNRNAEKQLLDQLSIPTSPYLYCVTAQEALEKLKLPMVVKSCRDGYDGKNQWRLKTQADVDAFDRFVADSRGTNSALDEYIIESWVSFEKEVSLISVRGINGEITHYPLTENIHEKGILIKSIAPATQISEHHIECAQSYTEKLLTSLNYVGVIAMECFVKGDELIVNELAPRVHNSGHWTQMGSITCQFENHVRAISGFALGSTQILGVAGMVNLIGSNKPPLMEVSKLSKIYWYNKIVKPQRKLGHINFLASDYQQLAKEMGIFSSI